MNEVEEQLRDWADMFVNLYLSQGELTAGKWASDYLKPSFYETLKPYVKEEFERRGYEYIPLEEN